MQCEARFVHQELLRARLETEARSKGKSNLTLGGMLLHNHMRTCAVFFCCCWRVYAASAAASGTQIFDAKNALDVPRLSDLAGTWLTYRRGLGHPSDPVEWDAPKHGIALPTANSELGSMIADENV